MSTSNKSASGGICKLSSTRWFPESRTWKRSEKISRRQCTYHPYKCESLSKGKSPLPRADDNKAMQREIDDLKKQLHRAQQRWSPSNSDVFSNEEEDTIYRQRSRTPPSESFSYDEKHHHQRKRRSPSRKWVGTDVMKNALSQISKSPFTRVIEKAKLPRRFHQPTFIIYNGWTDPVEHVSQFKQKMAAHS